MTRSLFFRLVMSLLCVLPFWVGCAHDTESHDVAVTRIDPDLVCRAQRANPLVTLAISGSGFAPMPTNVLASPTKLILPEIALTKVTELDGAAASGPEQIFPGAPDQDFSQNIHWSSESAMEVRISEADAFTGAPLVDLAAGIYDVTVTNPDGHHRGSLPNGLAVVEPPSITSTAPAPTAVCIEQAPRQLELIGTSFLTVAGVVPTVTLTAVAGGTPVSVDGAAVVPSDCTDLPQEHAGGTVSVCNHLTVSLPQGGTLPAGTYSVVVTSPPPADCASSESVLVVIVDPPSVTAIDPTAACVAQGDRLFQLTGAPFARVGSTDPTVTLTDASGATTTLTPASLTGCNPPSDVPADFGVDLCDGLTFTVPSSVAAGSYQVTVTNADPVGCTSVESIPLTIVDPPTITTVDPDAVCAAEGDRPIRITGTNFASVGAGPTITVTDSTGATTDYPADVIDGCGATVATVGGASLTLCTGIVFNLPQGTADGSYTVSLTNPDPVGCTSTEDAPLLVVAPPSITTLDPTAVCLDQAAQQFTLTGTHFATVGTDQPIVVVTDTTGTATEYTPDAVTDCGAAVAQTGGSDVTLCTTVTFTLPQGTANGGYTIAVRNPAPVGCTSVETIELLVAAPPTVTSVVPNPVCVDAAAQQVTVTGTDIVVIGTAAPTITLTDGSGASVEYPADNVANCGSPVGTLNGENIVLCTDVLFTVPQTASFGTYDLTLNNPSPLDCPSTTPATLTVTIPPTVNSVSPGFVCSGGSELAIDGENFLTGSTITVSCDSGTVDSLATEASPDGTTLSVRFGFGAVPGDTCDVIVSNAGGCASAMPYPQIQAVDGPIVFYSAPPVAYNGINTQIKLFMTAITGTPVVKIVPSGQISGEIVLDTTVDPGNAKRLQALVPSGTAAGTYDILVSDDTGCSATMVDGLVVTDTQTIDLDRIVQPFGQVSVSNAVTVFRTTGTSATNVAFAPTPTAFLNPTNATATDPAVQLEGVTFIDADTLTAVVPDGIALGDYDLVVVDAAGNVGVLSNAYTAVTDAPPTVDNVYPQSIVNSDTFVAPDGSQQPQALTIFGDNFVGASVDLVCQAPDGSSVAPASVGTGTEVCDVNGCTLAVSVDGNGLAPGDTCVVRVTNSDGTYADYSAIGVTNPSRNLSNPAAGPDMNVGRRGLGSGAVQATSAARFVYAIGGDGGPATATTPFDSVEFAPVGIFGGMQSWVNNRETLSGPRAFGGSTTVGRYVYVFGGTDGTSALGTAERALVLSPEEIPVITDVDLCLSGGTTDCFGVVPATDGLLAGEYSYRISAVIDPASVHNCGGETLASDPLVIKLPSIIAGGETRKVAVQLFWDPPVDSQGVVLEDIMGYRIYRTPADGQAALDEGLIGEVDAATFAFIDSGITEGAEQPLPQGSTSAWQVLPSLNVARNSLAATAARDPSTPGTWYLYALLGMDSGATDLRSGTPLTSFEYLDVQVLANERQDFGASWTVGADTTSLTGRFTHGAWAVDEQVLSLLSAGQTYIYVGGGRSGPANVDVEGSIENLAVQAGGDLAYNAQVQSSAPSRTGFATLAAFGRLFVLAGADPQPRADASSARIVDLNTVSTSFNNEGITLTESRFVPGSSIQSAFLFILGGQTSISANGQGAITGGTVTASTEAIVW